MRGRQTGRHLKLITALEARPAGAAPAELAAELGVTVRTLYRDLEVLHEVGYPLLTERDGREVRWRLLGPKRATAPRLADDEQVALAVGAALVSAYLPSRFGDAYRAERSPAAKDAIAQILTNSRMCAEGHRPICQDTGIVTVFVRWGQDCRLESARSLQEVIDEGVENSVGCAS